jgi:rod shape determining protein RodA
MALTIDRTEPVSILQRERPLRPDLILILSYVALSALGIVMVYTATAPALELAGADTASTMRRHAVFVAVGLVVFVVASLIDQRTLLALTPVAYIGSIVALALVLTPLGTEFNAARRWVDVGPLPFQPSEFAKIAVILALAALLGNGVAGKVRWDHIARAIVLVGIPAVLIFRQPDLGTMLVFGFVAVVMLFAAGTSWRQIAFLVIVATVGAIGIFQAGALRDFQIRRLTAFLDPTDDLAATALYNQIQSEIAIGSGGFLGKGIGQGTQTNLSFVPEQESDFIFTAVGEQLGFIGGAIVIALFGILIWRILVAAVNGRDRFGQLVAVGVASMLMFHVFVNIGMTMRLVPVTGLPLPFMSAGGTAFIAFSLALGMAHSVWMRRSPVPGE